MVLGDEPDGGEVGDGGDESGGIRGERCADAGTRVPGVVCFAFQ